MDIDFIEKLIALAKDSGVAGLEYEAGGETVRISMTGATVSNSTSPVTHRDAVETLPAEAAKPAPGAIRSGMVGTFYRASAPDAEPFVKQGDQVEEGQVLGLIEAMKMLNPIEADRAGRVLAIRIENGAMVERGTVLFEIGEA